MDHYPVLSTGHSVLSRPVGGWYHDGLTLVHRMFQAAVMHVKSLSPILNVSDLEESFAWFARFGWTRGFDWKAVPDGPLTFGSVCSGACEIFLCRDGQGGRGHDGQGAWMSLWVDDVDAVYAACLAAGLDIARPPKNESWNVRELHVRHPDGHMFRVGRSICANEEA